MAIAQGYCTTGDAVRHVGRGDRLLQANSPLSVTDVEAIIDGVAEELNGILDSLNYTLPISATDSPRAYGVLKYVNAVCAAADIEPRLYGEGGTVSENVEVLRHRCDGLKDRILDGTLRLRDAEGGPQEEGTLADSGTNDLLDSGKEREPFFTRDMEF